MTPTTLKHSKSAYEFLLRRGFTPPVDNFADYPANRGALTKTMKVAGEDVEFRVTLWWGEPGTQTGPRDGRWWHPAGGQDARGLRAGRGHHV